MTRKIKLVALALTVAFLLSASLSLYFITQEADHDCVGEGCEICALLSQCEHTLKIIFAFAKEAVLALSILHISHGFVKKLADITAQNTPVALKVELLN